MRYRSDTRQRLASKPQRRDTLQAFKARNFAGRVTRQRQGQLIFNDTDSVIANSNQTGSAGLYFDIDALRPRVETVLHEFFQRRGGTFDDLACGDLVDELRREHPNGHARYCTNLCWLDWDRQDLTDVDHIVSNLI